MRSSNTYALTILCSLWSVAYGVETPGVLVIKGGTVVNADRQHKADVLVQDGKIAEVSPVIQVPEGATVLDASGKLVMPGGIDPHTHLDAPMFGTSSCDDFARGQAAALAGGTTMHIDFALPVDHDLEAGFLMYQEKVKTAVMDFGLHMAVTRFDAKAAVDMAKLVQRGINSFKFFMAYKGTLQVIDEELVRGLQRCKELGALPMVHAENGDAILFAQEKTIKQGVTGPEGHYISRPDILEDEATHRAIKLAKMVNVPLYVVHVMSSGAADHIKNARALGQRVIGEAITSGLAAAESSVFSSDFKIASQFVMSPPIRSEEHQKKVRRAVAGGVLQIVGTDHCPFTASQKAAGVGDFRKIPNGVNGIEERMHVTWDVLVNSGLMSPSGFVSATSTAAAQTFNIYPRKGVIAPGSDADIIIFDPHLEHTISAATHHSAIDQNIYEGRKQKGKVVTTISQGKVVWDGEQLTVQPGFGRFVEAAAFGPLFEGLETLDASYLERKFPYGQVPVKRGVETGSKEEL